MALAIYTFECFITGAQVRVEFDPFEYHDGPELPEGWTTLALQIPPTPRPDPAAIFHDYLNAIADTVDPAIYKSATMFAEQVIALVPKTYAAPPGQAILHLSPEGLIAFVGAYPRALDVLGERIPPEARPPVPQRPEGTDNDEDSGPWPEDDGGGFDFDGGR